MQVSKPAVARFTIALARTGPALTLVAGVATANPLEDPIVWLDAIVCQALCD